MCQDSVQASSHASHQQSKHAHAVVRHWGELHSTSFSALNLGLKERALQLLRKQECAAHCLAGSWLIIAIGAESSLSASTLILINRSTATVPPCRSPEHSQPLLHRCFSISTISTAGEKAQILHKTGAAPLAPAPQLLSWEALLYPVKHPEACPLLAGTRTRSILSIPAPQVLALAVM